VYERDYSFHISLLQRLSCHPSIYDKVFQIQVFQQYFCTILLRRTHVSFLDVFKIQVISQCLNHDVPDNEAVCSLLLIYYS